MQRHPGKLARRGKHTKRAGKYLRYKSKSKKIRASKRYHRGNKRTYKRGKRFHRGGAHGFGDDIVPGSLSNVVGTIKSLGNEARPRSLIDKDTDIYTNSEHIQPLDDKEIPTSLNFFVNSLRGNTAVKMNIALKFEYKRTDGVYRFSEPRIGVFDVFLLHRHGVTTDIYLLRRDTTNKYDKWLVSEEKDWKKVYSKMVVDGFGLDKKKSGTYIFPESKTNTESFNQVDQLMKEVKQIYRDNFTA